MRKVKGYVHINAPIHAVQQLADDARRPEWLTTRRTVLLKSLAESWEATEVDGGTRFTLHLDYRTRLPFLAPLVADGLHQSVSHSLSRLKSMAEGSQIH